MIQENTTVHGNKFSIPSGGNQIQFVTLHSINPRPLSCQENILDQPFIIDLIPAIVFYYFRPYHLYIHKYANQNGDSVTLAMNITEPGFYYLRIHDIDNDFNTDFTALQPYRLTIEGAEFTPPAPGYPCDC
jgi:hypothetical protein